MKKSKLIYALTLLGVISTEAQEVTAAEPMNRYEAAPNGVTYSALDLHLYYMQSSVSFITWNLDVNQLPFKEDNIEDALNKLGLENPGNLARMINGVALSFGVGYKTKGWGRVELEGIMDAIDEPIGKNQFQQFGTTIMGNWYFDLISTPTFDIFAGAGIGYSFRSVSIRHTLLPSVDNWAAQERAGVKWNISPRRGLALSYGMFILPTRSTLTFSNDVLNTIGEKVQSLLNLPEYTTPTRTPYEASYKNHGIRLDAFLKF